VTQCPKNPEEIDMESSAAPPVGVKRKKMKTKRSKTTVTQGKAGEEARERAGVPKKSQGNKGTHLERKNGDSLKPCVSVLKAKGACNREALTLIHGNAGDRLHFSWSGKKRGVKQVVSGGRGDSTT